jgi:hypothetical protein
MVSVATVIVGACLVAKALWAMETFAAVDVAEEIRLATLTLCGWGMVAAGVVAFCARRA